MKRIDLSNRDRGEAVDPPERVHDPAFATATYDSVLVLDNVRSDHYHTVFRCEATNRYGAASHTIELVKPGAPDMPKNVELTAVDDTRVSLAWVPGFNGGFNQTFDIRVVDDRTGHQVLKLKNIRRVTGNGTTIMGLDPKTRYLIKVRARNRAGFSNFTEEMIIRTRRK